MNEKEDNCHNNGSAPGDYRCYPYPDGIMDHPELNKIETDDEKANDFISLCSTIEKILTDSDEWKAFPYYETYMD